MLTCWPPSLAQSDCRQLTRNLNEGRQRVDFRISDTRLTGLLKSSQTLFSQHLLLPSVVPREARLLHLTICVTAWPISCPTIPGSVRMKPKVRVVWRWLYYCIRITFKGGICMFLLDFECRCSCFELWYICIWLYGLRWYRKHLQSAPLWRLCT